MEEETGEAIVETMQQAAMDVAANLSQDTATNSTGKLPSTTEGIALAYGSLVIMAILPIIFGSMRSVKLHKSRKVGDDGFYLDYLIPDRRVLN